MKQLDSLEVQVLVCSVDSQFVHMSWEEHELKKLMPNGVPYPMLADPGGKVGRAYDVFDDEANVNFRGRFIIDPDGIVQSAEVLTPPVGRNVPEMVRQLRGFAKVRETGGSEVCPAGWKEGKETLKPSAALVGKVADTWKQD